MPLPSSPSTSIPFDSIEFITSFPNLFLNWFETISIVVSSSGSFSARGIVSVSISSDSVTFLKPWCLDLSTCPSCSSSPVKFFTTLCPFTPDVEYISSSLFPFSFDSSSSFLLNLSFSSFVPRGEPAYPCTAPPPIELISSRGSFVFSGSTTQNTSIMFSPSLYVHF